MLTGRLWLRSDQQATDLTHSKGHVLSGDRWTGHDDKAKPIKLRLHFIWLEIPLT